MFIFILISFISCFMIIILSAIIIKNTLQVHGVVATLQSQLYAKLLRERGWI